MGHEYEIFGDTVREVAESIRGERGEEKAERTDRPDATIRPRMR